MQSINNLKVIKTPFVAIPTPAAYWKLNEYTNPPTVVPFRKDSVGVLLLEDHNTVTHATGKIGDCAHFVAANGEYLYLADNATLSTGDIDYTFSFWVNLTSKTNQSMIITKTANSNRDEYLIRYHAGNDRFQFEMQHSDGSYTSTPANNLGSPSTGVWYFVVCWHDKTTNTLNIQVNNGTVDSVSTGAKVPQDTNAAFYLGAYQGGLANTYLDGDLDEVRFWRQLLTADQRTALYAITTEDYYLYSQENSAHPSAALTTPTHDGSGKAVHPDVFDAGAGNTWNGYRYWMAHTPWPGENSTYEKPNIIASSDGATWVVPVGLTNPVEPGQASGLDPDPDIIVAQDNKMYLFWVWEDSGTNTNKIYVRSSSDGNTWSDRAELLSGVQRSYLSPAVLYDGSQYVMYYVDEVASPSTVCRRTCATPDGVWSDPVVVNMPVLAGKEIWHLDVIKVEAVYYALVLTSDVGTFGGVGNVLRLQKSVDGRYFADLGAVLKDNYIGTIWDKHVYRGSLVPAGAGVFDVFYSARNTLSGVGDWRIGKTQISY